MKTRVGEKSSALQCDPLFDEFHEHCLYLVGTLGGLLMIIRHYELIQEPILQDGNELSAYFCRTRDFSIYRLSQSEWLEMKSLDNYVIVI